MKGGANQEHPSEHAVLETGRPVLETGRPTTDNDTYEDNACRVSQADCIPWTGYVDPEGYGKIHIGDTTISAHRAIWIEAHGPLPHELVVDHLCRNKRCVNLEHLEAVTWQENTQRAPHVNKSHCPRGHALEGSNVYVQIDRRGHSHRSCQICRREYRRRQVGTVG